MTDKLTKSQQGKKNRLEGAKFERSVRADLESKGWIVAKWTNNVETICPDDYKGTGNKGLKKLIPAKSNRFNMRTCGFPDFVCFRRKFISGGSDLQGLYEVIGVEVKSNGYLDKEEKEKCRWLLDNNVFSKILIASKQKRYIDSHFEFEEIKYSEFERG